MTDASVRFSMPVRFTMTTTTTSPKGRAFIRGMSSGRLTANGTAYFQFPSNHHRGSLPIIAVRWSG